MRKGPTKALFLEFSETKQDIILRQISFGIDKLNPCCKTSIKLELFLFECVSSDHLSEVTLLHLHELYSRQLLANCLPTINPKWAYKMRF